MLPELVALCRSTVQIAARTSVDSYGEPVYSADVARRCRVTGRVKTITNVQGQQVTSTHQIYLADAGAVGPHDRITLSTGDVNSTETGARQPPVIAIGRSPDDLGRLHTMVFV